MNYILSAIIALAVTIGGWFGIQEINQEKPQLGVFGDPFISLQLANDPDNGECLTTDGTNNTWSSSCGGGGTYPFTPTVLSGLLHSATTSPMLFYGGLITSSSTIGNLTSGTFTATTSVAVTGTTTTQSLQIGSTAIADNGFSLSPLTGFDYGSSETTGGLGRIILGTVDEIGLAISGTNSGSSRMLSIVQNGDSYSGNPLHIRNDGTGTSLNIIGNPTGLGVIKTTIRSGADADASIFSGQIDDDDAQGIFLLAPPGHTGKLANFRVSSTSEIFTILGSNGYLGLATDTPYARLSVVGQIVGEYITATSTTISSTFAGGIGVGSVFSVDTSGNIVGVTINTGQGANELYAMNQNVRTFDDVQFSQLSLGKAGATNVGVDIVLNSATTTGFRVESDAATRQALSAYVTGDSQTRLNIRSDGLIAVGSGSVAADTNLYRIAPNWWKTDDNLEVTGIVDAASFVATSSTATSTFAGGISALSLSAGANGLTVSGTSNFNGDTNGISLNEIEDLTADKTFTMAANNLTFQFTTPSDGLTIDSTGAFTDHLLHIHQSAGNPGAGTQLLHIEATDADVDGLLIAVTASAKAIDVSAGETWLQGTYISSSTIGNLTAGVITATSTTATSTFAGGISITGGGLKVSTVLNCTEALETDANGNLVCGTDETTASGYPFTPTTLSGITYSATTSPLLFYAPTITSSSTVGNLTVGVLTATTTTATSTFSGGIVAKVLQVGSTAIGTNVLKLSPVTSYGTSNSESVGGILNMNLGTTDALGAALYTNSTGSNRLLSLVCDAATYSGNCFHVRNDGSASAFNIIGAPTGKGVGKFSVWSGADADASALSLEVDDDNAQGLFFQAGPGWTGKLLNFRISSTTEVLSMLGTNGYFGLATSSPYARLSVVGEVVGSHFTATTTATSTFSGNLKIGQQLVMNFASTTGATTQTINWNSGNTQRVLLQANTTFVINATSSNPIDGGKYLLKVCQGGAGNYTTTFATPEQLRWIGITPATTTVPTGLDNCAFMAMIYDGLYQTYNIASTTGKSR